MQKGTLWNWILKVLKYKNEIYQRIELICLVRCLHVKLWLLKCQKWLIFCIFSWWLQNCHNLVKSPPERSSWVVLENSMVIRLWSYRSWKIKGKDIKKLPSQQEHPRSWIFKVWHFANGSSESNNPWHFLKKLKKIIQKIQKMSHFLYLNPFYPLVYFIFAFQDL